MNKRVMAVVDWNGGTEPKRYESEDGYVMQREQGKTPNGNEIGGRWVLRDPLGNMVEIDQYRNDLAERHHLDLRD
jgi:hypothetical protein